MAFLTEHDRTYKTPEDICAHLGDSYSDFNGAIVPPIYQNTLFVHPTEVNGMTSGVYDYTRITNPTVEIAERKIAALEGGDGALCFGSGMAAISAAVLHFVRSGSHIVLVDTAYGGAMSLTTNYLKEKFNVSVTLVDGCSADEVISAIREDTDLIYLESPSSLVFRMQDIEVIAAAAKKRGIGTVIDNTYSTPILQNPLKYGIDIVCHSATKYLGGHSDIMGGAVVSRRDIIESILYRERNLISNIMDPHQAWLLIRGMRTLPIRMKQHGINGLKVSEYLEKHPMVERVFYPGSATYSQPELFGKYMSGTNGLMSVVLRGNADDARRFVGNLHYFQNGCSWGGFESLALYLGDDDRRLIRLHIGLEDVNTLTDDIGQALERVFG